MVPGMKSPGALCLALTTENLLPPHKSLLLGISYLSRPMKCPHWHAVSTYHPVQVVYPTLAKNYDLKHAEVVHSMGIYVRYGRRRFGRTSSRVPIQTGTTDRVWGHGQALHSW